MAGWLVMLPFGFDFGYLFSTCLVVSLSGTATSSFLIPKSSCGICPGKARERCLIYMIMSDESIC